MRSTVAPWKVAVTAASSATGRSEVPAAQTAIRPGRAGAGVVSTVMQRAASWKRASGRTAATVRCTSAVVRVTSTRWPRAAIRSTIATICSGVLPAPKTVSGKPRRRARWWSTLAKPRSS